MSGVIKYKIGEVIMTSHEEYSDYHVSQLYEVLEDFEISSMVKMLHTLEPEEFVLNDDGTFNSYESNFKGLNFSKYLFDWLETSNLVKPVKSRELHMGSYGDICLREG